jgi:hypothetical protein
MEREALDVLRLVVSQTARGKNRRTWSYSVPARRRELRKARCEPRFQQKRDIDSLCPLKKVLEIAH